MNIQLVSDLHLEFSRGAPLQPAPGADVLVLAGDIGVGTQAVRAFAEWPTPVLYVLGNHEAYGARLDETLREARRASRGTSVQVLNNDSVTMGRVRFLGTTLWTDYELHGESKRRESMTAAERQLLDHQAIRGDSGFFSPAEALKLHQVAREWLFDQLMLPHDGPTVVVSHHGPHPNSVHPRYAGNPLNPAFNSDLTALLPLAKLWLHGHVHDSFDYVQAGCRVVANPRGYPRNWKSARSAAEVGYENEAFDPMLVVSVP